MTTRLLSIYLNDHLAGSIAGVELARRVRDSNRDDPEFGPPLEATCTEIEADRDTLVELLERLGGRRDPVKPALAWTAEKLGRLKTNGQLVGYSPLSRLVELEGLALGITGKRHLWRALERSLPSVEGFDFELLGERAADQHAIIEELRLKAAGQAFAAEAATRP